MKKQQHKTPTHIPVLEQLVKHSIRRRLRCRIKTIFYGIACLSTISTLFAVVPAPDGGYPGGNTAEGDFALLALSIGTGNTALGFDALAADTAGSNNTATGEFALYFNSTGAANTATGAATLFNNTTGNANTAIGFKALDLNTSGFNNTATGYEALYSNKLSGANTANGYQALYHNTGAANTAVGASALYWNAHGFNNTATGYQALQNNSTGSDNTAVGYLALQDNTGDVNTGVGYQTLANNTTGRGNVGMGNSSAFQNTTGSDNTSLGGASLFSNTSGSRNIAIGSQAGTNLTIGNDNIDIGNPGVAGESSTIRIGQCQTQTRAFMAGIWNVIIPNGLHVVIDPATCQLGVPPSSARFKEKIEPMNKASETILALKPVTFNYKQEYDPNSVPQFGLLAEEVAKVDPALVVRDEQGKPYGVRYDAVNAMLLNEFLKEHQQVEEQEKTLGELKVAFGRQEEELRSLRSGLEKVNNQLELSRPAARVVSNNQ
ncbi:MAG TPA: tail fiber domain-containing protein [Candidatus Udaeobacter sp.]|jgi:hypothetical protein|nr:tail fiber domain-containing protein [Candidatus Udaeobacter sp.]